MLVKWQLERQMYDFKKYFSPDFVYIYRAKNIFSRNHFSIANNLTQGGLIVNDHLIVLKASPTLFSQKTSFFTRIKASFRINLGFFVVVNRRFVSIVF